MVELKSYQIVRIRRFENIQEGDKNAILLKL